MKPQEKSLEELVRENRARARERERQLEAPDGATSGTIMLTDELAGAPEPLNDGAERHAAREALFDFEATGGDLGGVPDPNQPEGKSPYDSNPSFRICSVADTLSRTLASFSRLRRK